MQGRTVNAYIYAVKKLYTLNNIDGGDMFAQIYMYSKGWDNENATMIASGEVKCSVVILFVVL